MNTHTQTIRPICAICQKPVDMIIKDDNTDGSVTYTVECHGEREAITLKPNDMIEIINIEIGTAFTKALHGGEMEVIDRTGDGKA